MPTTAPRQRTELTALDVTPELLRRHDRPVPRYTSYPSADRFSDAFGPADYAAALARADRQAPQSPLSLYVHLPFCQTMCAYCACTLVVSNSPAKKAAYLDQLLVEVDRVVEHLPRRRRVAEIHLGGGTPTSYDPEELARLLAHLEDRFDVSSSAEVSLEVDPRRVDAATVHELRDVGFTRLSAGVQDFDPDVQRAVGRVQSFEQTKQVTSAARSAGFSSISVDLIYGLPRQTLEGFARTLEQALALAPDRIALFSFAYVPDAKPNQRRLDISALPGVDDKLALFCLARRAFLEAGYVAIGMDHFARPTDGLARAQEEGTLGRNFQGYTVVRGADTLGFGMSAIGDVGGAYVQSHKRLPDWLAALDRGELPTARGLLRSADDEARRYVITELMCNLHVDDDELRRRHGVSLVDFRVEQERLRELVDEGLVDVTPASIRVTTKGRLFVRTVASCFDRYLYEEGVKLPYSRAV